MNSKKGVASIRIEYDQVDIKVFTAMTILY